MTTTSGTAPSVVSGTTQLPASSSSSSSSLGSSTGATIAGNFQTFLTLLTTQLKNQDPLSPLDTNQFTAQLVQFAQVEQQLKTNDPARPRWSRCNRPRRTPPRSTSSARRSRGRAPPRADQRSSATWQSQRAKPATVDDSSIKSATGQTGVHRQLFAERRQLSPFTWDGKDSSGLQWPDGNYTISVDRAGRQRPAGGGRRPRCKARCRLRRSHPDAAGAFDRRHRTTRSTKSSACPHSSN